LSSTTTFNGPRSSIDLWSDEELADPFASYAELRDLGPAVWLDRYDTVALPRFAEVRGALANWRMFSSASGVGVDAATNTSLSGSGTLGSDPPEHTAARRGLARELASRRVDAEAGRFRRIATTIVEPLLRRQRVDAIGELARPYVATVIGELVGLPDDIVVDLPGLAARAFDMFGPTGGRQREGLRAFDEIMGRAIDIATGGDPTVPVTELSSHDLERIGTYMFPGVDTTVQAVAVTLYLFARHPDQWTALRADPSLIPAAIGEALRLHSPVRHFTRLTTGATDVGTTTLAPDTRALIMYGSANRDERRFPEPDRFDITRLTQQHMAFGHGVHHCVGANLARRELTTLLEVLIPRVRRLELQGTPAWGTNLAIHGLERLELAFVLE
jgi:cytochrome P450